LTKDRYRLRIQSVVEKLIGEMMSVLIRDYVPTDREAVNRVALAAFDQYEGHYVDWATFRAGIGRMADLAEDADLIIAEHEGLAGAVVHVGPGKPRNPIFPEHWSIIRMLVVEPQRCGQGIGKALVAAALRRACQVDAPVVGLHTSPIMTHALSLYCSIGFEHDVELPPLGGVPYSRYVLSRAAIPTALDLLHKR
jgi:GNAT superfamily N-acetyltransferase